MNQKTKNKQKSWEEIVSDFCLQSYGTIPDDFRKEKFKADSDVFAPI